MLCGCIYRACGLLQDLAVAHADRCLTDTKPRRSGLTRNDSASFVQEVRISEIAVNIDNCDVSLQQFEALKCA